MQLLPVLSRYHALHGNKGWGGQECSLDQTVAILGREDAHVRRSIDLEAAVLEHLLGGGGDYLPESDNNVRVSICPLQEQSLGKCMRPRFLDLETRPSNHQIEWNRCSARTRYRTNEVILLYFDGFTPLIALA
jgi:hypothetical protein